jgi:peptidoglycan/xylan/chitin deacetylase (PgdA/CDA1 family)
MPGVIAMGWDDGSATDLTVACQMQIDRGMIPKGTSFIIGSYNTGTWLSDEQKVELSDKGWDLQCHTYSHIRVDELTAAQIRADLLLNDAYFESLGLPKPQHLAFPFGLYTAEAGMVASRYRKSMRSTQTGFFQRGVNLWQIPEFNVNVYTETEGSVGITRLIDIAVKHDLMMVTNNHSFANQDEIDIYGEILDHAIRSGIRMVTFSELYELIR